MPLHASTDAEHEFMNCLILISSTSFPWLLRLKPNGLNTRRRTLLHAKLAMSSIMPKSGRVRKGGKRGYVKGKISGRVRDALDRGRLSARIVKHGQELRAVLIQELAANDGS